MSRHLVTLMPAQVAQLAGPCDACQFWQGSIDSLAGKEEWARAVLTDWGSFGQAVEIDGVLVAHVLYAPARYLPRVARCAAGPVSDDAVLLAGLRVLPELRGIGLGKLLVAKAAADLMRREVRALEAFGTAAQIPGVRASQCAMSASFLTARGFITVRSRSGMSLLRLDLAATEAWHLDLEPLRRRIRALAKASAAPSPWNRPATARGTVRETQDARPRASAVSSCWVDA
jgi:GNAT superfamily N-acetyltransferase